MSAAVMRRICGVTCAISGTRSIHISPICAEQVMVDGLSLNYQVAGDGTKVALCLPGALGTIESDFAPQLKNLPNHGIKVVCWDPPGYGKSRPPPRNYTMDFLRNDATIAANMMKNLGYNKYSLLGWSDGGISAMMLAATFPQHVERMVLWGSNAYVAEEDVKIYNGIRDVNKWSERMRAPLEAVYGKEYFKAAWEGWVDILTKIFKEKDGDLCREDLAKISCPTLIVHGAKDPMVPLYHPHYLRDNIKNSQLIMMENGKHNIHLRFAEEFNKIISEFLHKDSSLA
ncbi:hypothetical protein Pcinc_038758 [Petrolisthes cinctipes]|uniref:AB hydrolase-1 domain-containing protein n=1 Tax=Petrolisthes cinctipes TaxID=88211 RepID=A0AAE1BQ70_PETCI|nr:hypothetical protein Pcinc_038758 [Petrolisthes cinctipes]